MDTPSTAAENTVPSVITRTWSKLEVLQTLEDLRDVWKDYAELLTASLDLGPLPEEKRTLIEFHRGRFLSASAPPQRMGEMVTLLGDLMEMVQHDNLAFRVPTRSAMLPEESNTELSKLSRRLRSASVPLDSMAGSLMPVPTAVRESPLPTGDGHAAPSMVDPEKINSLKAATASLFKGIVRQDWADVNLVMNHINLVTTSGKSQSVVREVGRIARDIYNSLNEFSQELDYHELSQASQELPDAIVKLNAVIQRLEDFANASLDALEQLTADALDDEQTLDAGMAALAECAADLERLAQSHPALAEKVAVVRQTVAERLQTPLQTLKAHRQQVRDVYLALISNMSFQDLTGQTLKKVIQFIENLQNKLVVLITRQGSAEQRPVHVAPIVPMEGPDPNQGVKPLSQTEVDKTLANLGF